MKVSRAKKGAIAGRDVDRTHRIRKRQRGVGKERSGSTGIGVSDHTRRVNLEIGETCGASAVNIHALASSKTEGVDGQCG